MAENVLKFTNELCPHAEKMCVQTRGGVCTRVTGKYYAEEQIYQHSGVNTEARDARIAGGTDEFKSNRAMKGTTGQTLSISAHGEPSDTINVRVTLIEAANTYIQT